MTFDDLAGMDWDAMATTADWTKTLNDLLGLTDAATSPEPRRALADALDAFADNSSSDDLDVITRLDRVARKAARALRLANMESSIGELQAASADFRAVVKELSAASAASRKEASALRAEQVTAAVASLTGTIASLKALSQITAIDSDDKVALAITRVVSSAQTLRGLLEKPG